MDASFLDSFREPCQIAFTEYSTIYIYNYTHIHMYNTCKIGSTALAMAIQALCLGVSSIPLRYGMFINVLPSLLAVFHLKHGDTLHPGCAALRLFQDVLP